MVRARALAVLLGAFVMSPVVRAAVVEDLDDPPISSPPSQKARPAPAKPPPPVPTKPLPTPAKPPPAEPQPATKPTSPPAPASPAKDESPEPPPRPAPSLPERSPYPTPWPTVEDQVSPRSAPIPAPSAAPSAVPPGESTGSAAAAAPAVPPARRAHTRLGGYADALVFVTRDRDADFDLRRVGVELAHTPAPWLRFHLGAELVSAEHFGLPQAFVEAAPSKLLGVRTGLILLPLGLVNRRFRPGEYLTVDRPLTDQLIIPTAWRELGVSLFGELVERLRYEVGVVSALDGARFAAQAPLWGGRGNGRSIAIHDAAVTGRLELFAGEGFAVGAGGYYGKASGGHAELAGVKVGLVEGDVRLRAAGFDVRAEYVQLFIVNSYLVNDYLGLLGQDQVAARSRGFYAQAGYDLLQLGDLGTRQELLLFTGFELVNPRQRMSPYNYNLPDIAGPGELSPKDPSPNKMFVRGGIVYRPHPVVAIKADIQVALSDEMPPPGVPMTLAGAPGTPVSLRADVAEAARGRSRLGFALVATF